MVDYRKFLRDKDEELVALYLGGLAMYASSRTLRLAALPNVEPGSFLVRVTGRHATIAAPSSEAFDLSHLPKEVGHFTGGYLVLGGRAERIELLGAPEPELLAPVRARRHESGALLLDEALFEGEVEAEARTALEEGRGLAGIKGVSPSLRGAFALATATRAAREANVGASPAELLKSLGPIAEGGPAAARAVLTALEQARAEERQLAEARVRDGQVRAIAEHVARNVARRPSPHADLDPVERADRALTAAGARLLHARRLTEETLEVRFHFMGERFISVVHPLTLHVFDAGVCLAGADEEVTLESLPSVIREAIEEETLVITRR